jgi:hypothetical protein
MLNTYKELYFDLLEKKFPARADALGIGRILGSAMSQERVDQDCSQSVHPPI